MHAAQIPGSPLEPIPHGVYDDEDLVLGCECALPALQLDAWDPQAARAMEGVLQPLA